MNLQGKYLLYFSHDTFYKEIESITIDGVALEQKDEGALLDGAHRQNSEVCTDWRGYQP